MIRGAFIAWLAWTSAVAAVIPDRPAFLWRFEADGVAHEAPAGDGHRIFLATDAGTIFALDDRGSRVWKTSFNRKEGATRFSAPLVVVDGVVFARAGEAVFALDAAGGKPVEAEYPKPGVARKGFEARVVVSEDDRVVLRDVGTGRVIWSKAVGAEITAVALIDEMIVVCAADGSVSAWGAPRGARDSNVDES